MSETKTECALTAPPVGTMRNAFEMYIIPRGGSWMGRTDFGLWWSWDQAEAHRLTLVPPRNCTIAHVHVIWTGRSWNKVNKTGLHINGQFDPVTNAVVPKQQSRNRLYSSGTSRRDRDRASIREQMNDQSND